MRQTVVSSDSILKTIDYTNNNNPELLIKNNNSGTL